MIRIRVEYDAYNRTFKLTDREFGSVLEDGAVYELLAPLAVVELEEGLVSNPVNHHGPSASRDAHQPAAVSREWSRDFATGFAKCAMR